MTGSKEIDDLYKVFPRQKFTELKDEHQKRHLNPGLKLPDRQAENAPPVKTVALVTYNFGQHGF